MGTVYKDLDLNFGSHPVKKDVVPLTDENAIVRAVYNLIMTNNYERPFRPELGSGVRQLLFENLLPSTGRTLQRMIRETISNFEPRVKVKSVDVIIDEENNGYSVRLEFFVNTQAIPFITSFLLSRIR